MVISFVIERSAGVVCVIGQHVVPSPYVIRRQTSPCSVCAEVTFRYLRHLSDHGPELTGCIRRSHRGFAGASTTVDPMSQPPQSPRSASPLTARLYDLEYPRSLGVYSTYQEVQSVVDTLADKQFPVQSTLIVGTDLKLMERVTGRRTWPKVITQGALSGLWMGLFLGLLLMLLSPGSFGIVISSVVLGIVFFTVSAVISYAMTGGKRDFTSMTSTIPMQYELLVEHKHAAQARAILAESGAAPAFGQGTAPGASSPASPHPSAPQGSSSQGGYPSAPTYGAAPGEASPTPHHGGPRYGAPASPAPSAAPQSPSPARASYGLAQPSAQTPSAPSRPARQSYGMPAGAPLREEQTTEGASSPGSRPVGAAGSVEGQAGAQPSAPQPSADDDGR